MTVVALSIQGSITPFTAGQRATLSNAGVIDLSSGNTRTSDTLTVQGNYAGNGGQLFLQSVLGDDNSASDKLVINDGTLTGNTLISVTNLGGAGALTRQNGIQLVQAQGTAISTNDAFALKSAVSAGAFDYRLFKGGITAGTENSWFLRSAVVAPAVTTLPNPDPGLPPITVPVVATLVAAPAPFGGPELPALPAAVPGTAPIALYRPEVPTWSVLPPAAAQLSLAALGTFHDRQDDGISQVSFDSDSAWTGRLGARLKGRYSVGGQPLEPYLRANLWHTFSGTDRVTFDHADQIETQQKSTQADVGVGLILSLAPSVSVYASADYSSNIDSTQQRAMSGNAGLRVSW